MIRFFITALKIALVVAISLWFADHPGWVEIEWQDYIIQTSIGVLALITFFTFGAFLLINKIIESVFDIPALLSMNAKRKAKERGIKALTHTLISLAEGDPRMANKYARQVYRYLTNPPLKLLLTSQISQMQGDEDTARVCFLAMLENKHTYVLGLRGLMNIAISNRDPGAALHYAKKAFERRPRSGWVMKILFRLQTLLGHWDDAQQILDKMIRTNAIPKKQALEHKATLLIIKSRATQDLSPARAAFKLTPSFVPAVLQYTKLLQQNNMNRRALNILEKGWKQNPAPQIADEILNMTKPLKPATRLRKVERIFAHHRDNATSHLMLARAALQGEIWGVARHHLEKSVELYPTAQAYEIFAKLELKELNDNQQAKKWLDKKATATDITGWACTTCHFTAQEWHPTCPSCHSFNSFGDQAGNTSVHMIPVENNFLGIAA